MYFFLYLYNFLDIIIMYFLLYLYDFLDIIDLIIVGVLSKGLLN